MFQDGVKKTISSMSRAIARLSWFSSGSDKAHKMQPGVSPQTKPHWPGEAHAKDGHPSPNMNNTDTGFLRFPFSNFRYSLTLFSKFFASFPHGTCSLSVSHQYLALDGIYHPLWAAIPSNSTRRWGMLRLKGKAWTGVSPSLPPCSNGLIPTFAPSPNLDHNSNN